VRCKRQLENVSRRRLISTMGRNVKEENDGGLVSSFKIVDVVKGIIYR